MTGIMSEDQRIIRKGLPANGRAQPEISDPMQTLVCEKCARPIPVAHLAEGRALQTGASKVICAVCCKHTHSPRRRISTAVKLPPKPSNRIVRIPTQPPPRPKITAETAIVPRIKPMGSERATAAVRSNTSLRIERERHWVCHVCGVPVDPKQVTGGGAELREGKLWCRACFKKQVAPTPARRWVWPSLSIILLAMSIAVAVPGAALVVLGLASASATIVVLLSGELPWAMRAGLAAMALSACGICLVFVGMLQERATTEQARVDLSGYTQRIDAALVQHRIRDALAEMQKLKVAAVQHAGAFATPVGEERLTSARKSINAWLAAKYPDSNDIGRQLVLAFAEAFPAEDEDRFERIVVEGDRLSAVLRLSDDAAHTEPGQGPLEARRYTQSSLDAWLIATFVFDRLTAIGKLHLALKMPAGAPREIEVTRSQFQALRRQPLPHVLLGKADWARNLEPAEMAHTDSR